MPESSILWVIIALILSTGLRLWLSVRQEKHVLAHKTEVPAAFQSHISLAAHQHAADYTVAKTRLGRLQLGISVALLLALTYGGGLNILHQFWENHTQGIFYGIAMIGSVVLLGSLLDLPLDLYRQFHLEARFGFNRMTPLTFCTDLIKQTLLAMVLGLPFLAVILWLMGAMGSLWWLYAWLFWMGFNLFILFAYPLWIAPLFNRFTPLEEGEIKTRVTALLARANFSAKGLFVMDGSRRSGHGNAYFTGFGKARRIVFFDTLLERLSPAQIEAVLAHELGHFHHKHIIKRIVTLFGLSLLFLALLGQLIEAPWFYSSLGVQTENTALGLILFSMIIPIFLFPFTPISSALSRRDEFQADAYAKELASGKDLVTALVKLYEDNASTLTPDPIHSLFYDSHPPASQRVARLQEQTSS